MQRHTPITYVKRNSNIVLQSRIADLEKEVTVLKATVARQKRVITCDIAREQIALDYLAKALARELDLRRSLQFVLQYGTFPTADDNKLHKSALMLALAHAGMRRVGGLYDKGVNRE